MRDSPRSSPRELEGISSQRGNGEGSVYRVQKPRKSGEPAERWVAQVRIDGRQRRTFSATEAEAKRALRQLLKSVDDWRPAADGNLLLSSLLDQWEAKVLPNKNIKGSTMGRHKWALNILRADLGSTKVRTLSPERVEKALTDRAQAGYSRSSLTNLRGTLSQVLKWGVRRDLVARNVASVVELPAEARAPKEGRSMSRGQAREFIAAAVNSPLEAMWLAMIYLGLRPGEAAGLSWPDIDFDRKTIHIWRAISRDEHGAIILSEPKTAQSVRSLDAPEVVLEAFRRHRIEQKRRQLEVGEIWSNPEALVFTSPTGHPIDPMVCRKDFTKLVSSKGLSDWTPNELRHSAASLMSDAGMPIEQVADQLGHKDLRMLQKHYRHRIRPTVSGGTVLDTALRS